MRLRSPRGTGLVARTLGAGVATAAAVGVFLAPAAHAAGPTVTIAEPVNGAVVSTAVVRITGQVTMGQGGTVNDQIHLELQSLEGHGNQTFAVNANRNPAPFEWNAPTTFNGPYRLIVKATGRDGAIDTSPNEEGESRIEFSVAAPPAPPANVRSEVGDNRYVELNWDRNTEPDIVGYQVHRRHEDKAWEPVVNTVDAYFTDSSSASAGGTYEHRVYALRRGATNADGVASQPSETTSVEVDEPPPGSTPATSPGGGSGGTNNGGSGGISGPGGTGTNPNSGGAGGSNPDLARTGKVDLSGFSALLQNAQKPGAPNTRPTLPDGSFDPSLPFDGEGGEGEELGEDGTGLAIGVEEAGEPLAREKPIAFFAASMLVTAILMHVVWLKREVDKAPLDALPAD